MATATTRRFRGKLRDAYIDLIEQFPLSSISTEEDLEAAQEVIDRLLSKGKLLSGELMYLEALSDLVGAYEDKHYAIEPASDSAMLKHLMEAKGINQIELHRCTGVAKSTISEILSGKKCFTRSLIRTFANFFDVDKSVLAKNL